MKDNFWYIFDTFFILLVFLIPFFPALNISAEIDLASLRVIIAVIFFLWLAGLAMMKLLKPGFADTKGLASAPRQVSFFFTFQSVALLAVLAISTLSLIIAKEPVWGLRKLAVFLSIFPLYFVAAGRLRANRLLGKKIIKAILASAAVSAFFGLIQILSQFFIGQAGILSLYEKYIGPIFWGQNLSQMVAQYPSWLVNVSGATIMRAFGLFPDPHMMAFFFGLISPIALALLLFNGAKNRGLILIFGSSLLILFLTFSRGGYLGAAAALIFVIILSWRHLGQKKKRLILSALALGLFLMIIFAGPIISRFVSSFTHNEGSSLERLLIWKGSFEIFLSNPLLGVGLGNYPKAIEPLAAYRTPITSHNLYLDILSETGIFGLAAWVFLIFGSMWQLIKGFLGDKGDNEDKGEWGNQKALRIGLFGSLAYFSVHSFFETAIFSPAILALLMIIFALISATLKNDKQTA